MSGLDRQQSGAAGGNGRDNMGSGVLRTPGPTQPSTTTDGSLNVTAGVTTSSTSPNRHEQTATDIGKSLELRQKVSVWQTLRQGLQWSMEASRELMISRARWGVAGALVPIVATFMSGLLTDALKIAAGPSKSFSMLAAAGIGLAVVSVASSIASHFENAVSAKLSRATRSFTFDLVTRANLGLDIHHLYSEKMHSLIEKVSEGRWMIGDFGSALIKVITPIATVATGAVVLGLKAPILLPVVGALAVYTYRSQLLYAHEKFVADIRLRHIERQFHTLSSNLTNEAQAISLKMSPRSMELADQVAALNDKIEESRFEVEQRHFRRSRLTTAGMASISILATSYAIYECSLGALTIGDVGVIAGTALALAQSVRGAAAEAGTLLRIMPYIRRASQLVRQAESDQNAQAVNLPSPMPIWEAPSIVVRNFNGRVPSDKLGDRQIVLHDITLTIPAGKFVALVGQIGSGKSSFIKFLTGVFPVQNSDVLEIGTRRAATIPTRELHANTSYLPQKYWNIFGLTIADNIAKGGPNDPTPMSVADVAGRVGLLAELGADKDPAVLNQVLGFGQRRTRELSGGQHQLLATARALYKALADRSKFIVLDEPTANLDSNLQHHILELIRDGLEGTTRIVAAHDFGIIRNADLIVVFDKGRILDSGTHEALMARCRFYRDGFNKAQQRLAGRNGKQP